MKAWLSGLVIMGLHAVAAASTDGPDTSATANPPWHSLQYSANYLWANASATISLQSVAATEAAKHWMTPPETRPLYPEGNSLWYMHIDNRVESSRETIDSWLEPGNLRAYQRDRLSVGKQSRLKRYRFLRRGVFRTRSEPIDRKSSEPPSSWPVTSGANFQAPKEFAEKVIVTTPYGVLLAASLAPLHKLGDSHRLYVYTDVDYLQVDLTVTAEEPFNTNYQLDGQPQQSTINALAISLTTKPLQQPQEDKFSLLGFEGDMTIMLDPTNRLPLELRGRVPKLGNEAIKLQQASLSGTVAQP